MVGPMTPSGSVGVDLENVRMLKLLEQRRIIKVNFNLNRYRLEQIQGQSLKVLVGLLLD